MDRKTSTLMDYIEDLGDWLNQDNRFGYFIGLFVVLIIFVVGLVVLSQKPPMQRKEINQVQWIEGNSRNFIPNVFEMPSGFQLIDKDSGPISFSDGSGYQVTYTNPNFLAQGREVNVFYTVLLTKKLTTPLSYYQKMSSPSTYSAYDATTSVDFILDAEFPLVDQKILLYGTDLNSTSTRIPTISYQIIFIYKNFLGSVMVSGPVDALNSYNAQIIRSRLREAVKYYTYLVTKKISLLENVNTISQPAFEPISVFQQTITPTKRK